MTQIRIDFLVVEIIEIALANLSYQNIDTAVPTCLERYTDRKA